MTFICFLILYSSFGWLISLKMKRGDIADIFWGPGFSILFLVLLLSKEGGSVGEWIQFLSVLLWSLRLSIHIGFRNLKAQSTHEDFRYLNWRKQWGKNYVLISFFKIWLLQGVLLILVSTSFSARYFLNEMNPVSQQGFSYWQLLGCVVSLLGLTIETVADLQLNRFKELKKKKEIHEIFLMSGVWKYSRHPNYLGESIFWWGIFLQSYFMSSGNVFSVSLEMMGALSITLLLRFVSGVPLLEAEFKKRPGFEKYAEQVPIFLPKF